MKIRVILPFYNGMEFIKEQLDSLCKQKIMKKGALDIYIYDDGSKKLEFNKLQKLILNYSNIKLIKNKTNKKLLYTVFNAMNDATNAKIDFLFFSDQDDIGDPNKIYTQISKIKNNIVNTHSQQAGFYESNILDAIYKNPVAGHTKCVNLKKFNEISKINYMNLLNYLNSNKEVSNMIIHDTFLDIIFNIFKMRMNFINTPLVKHRIHDKSITNSGKINNGNKHSNGGYLTDYNRYYLGGKPLVLNVFNIKITPRKFMVICNKFLGKNKSLKSKLLVIIRGISLPFYYLHGKGLADLPFRLLWKIKYILKI